MAILLGAWGASPEARAEAESEAQAPSVREAGHADGEGFPVDVNGDGTLDRIVIRGGWDERGPFPTRAGIVLAGSSRAAWLSSGLGLEWPPGVVVWSWEKPDRTLVQVFVNSDDCYTEEFVVVEGEKVRELVRWNAGYSCCARWIGPVHAKQATPHEALVAAVAATPRPDDPEAGAVVRREVPDARPIRFFYALGFAIPQGSASPRSSLDEPRWSFERVIELPEIDYDQLSCPGDQAAIVTFEFFPETAELGPASLLCEETCLLDRSGCSTPEGL